MVLPLCNAAWKIYILNLMISKWFVFNEQTLRRKLLTLDSYKCSTSHLNPMPKELKMPSFVKLSLGSCWRASIRLWMTSQNGHWSASTRI